MKTIKEAKESVCPFFIITTSILAAADKKLNGYDTMGCMANDCNMWRKGPCPHPEFILHEKNAEEPPAENDEYVSPERPGHVPFGYEFTFEPETLSTFWREPESSVEARRPGYCGLAGKPEE